MKQKTKFLLVILVILFGFWFAVGSVLAATDTPPPGETKNCTETGGEVKEGKCQCKGGKTYTDKGCQCPAGQSADKAENCQLTNPAPGQLVSTDSFSKLLEDIIQILLLFAGAIAVIFLIIGGFRYITAVGSEEAMEKAKKTITGAVVGVVIIVMAFAIVSIINTLLTKTPDEQAKPIEASKETPKETPKDQKPPAEQEVQITLPVISEFIAGQPNSVTFTADNCSPCEWEINLSGTPAPLSFKEIGNPVTITVSPAETEANKTYTFSVKATNTANQKSAVKNYTVAVIAQEPGIPDPSVPQPFNFSFAANPVSFSCPLNDFCDIKIGTLSGGKTPYKLGIIHNMPSGLGLIVSGNDLVVSGSASQTRPVRRDIEIVMQDSSPSVQGKSILISIEVK